MAWPWAASPCAACAASLGQPAVRPRRPPRARRRRVPAAARGALVQIDGSPFRWLEERGPELMLLGAVDDATTEILALRFRPTEDVHGYASLFADICTDHGVPLAVYGDRLNLLVRNDRYWSMEEELAGVRFPTHLGRMLQELGTGYIAAHSPQAKGRIERLWATLQDRLVSELRLRGVSSVDAAEAFLPAFIADFNRRFGKPPAAAHAVWRRAPRDLPLLLSCRYQRRVARDNTVALGLRWVQLRRPLVRRRSASRCANCSMDVSSSTTTAASSPRRPPPRGPSSSSRGTRRPGIAGPGGRPPSAPRLRHRRRHAALRGPTRAAIRCRLTPGPAPSNLNIRGRTFSRSSKGGHFH